MMNTSTKIRHPKLHTEKRTKLQRQINLRTNNDDNIYDISSIYAVEFVLFTRADRSQNA